MVNPPYLQRQGMTPFPEVGLYRDRARQALTQARDVFKLGHYDLTISRAYYAMFYATCALLSSRGVVTKSHSAAHALFAQYFVKPGLIEAEYSRMLGNTFNLRLDSDYEIVMSHSQAEAENALEDAARFVERIETYMRSEGMV